MERRRGLHADFGCERPDPWLGPCDRQAVRQSPRRFERGAGRQHDQHRPRRHAVQCQHYGRQPRRCRRGHGQRRKGQQRPCDGQREGDDRANRRHCRCDGFLDAAQFLLGGHRHWCDANRRPGRSGALLQHLRFLCHRPGDRNGHVHGRSGRRDRYGRYAGPCVCQRQGDRHDRRRRPDRRSGRGRFGDHDQRLLGQRHHRPTEQLRQRGHLRQCTATGDLRRVRLHQRLGDDRRGNPAHAAQPIFDGDRNPGGAATDGAGSEGQLHARRRHRFRQRLHRRFRQIRRPVGGRRLRAGRQVRFPIHRQPGRPEPQDHRADHRPAVHPLRRAVRLCGPKRGDQQRHPVRRHGHRPEQCRRPGRLSSARHGHQRGVRRDRHRRGNRRGRGRRPDRRQQRRHGHLLLGQRQRHQPRLRRRWSRRPQRVRRGGHEIVRQRQRDRHQQWPRLRRRAGRHQRLQRRHRWDDQPVLRHRHGQQHRRSGRRPGRSQPGRHHRLLRQRPGDRHRWRQHHRRLHRRQRPHRHHRQRLCDRLCHRPVTGRRLRRLQQQQPFGDHQRLLEQPDQRIGHRHRRWRRRNHRQDNRPTARHPAHRVLRHDLGHRRRPLPLFRLVPRHDPGRGVGKGLQQRRHHGAGRRDGRRRDERHGVRQRGERRRRLLLHPRGGRLDQRRRGADLSRQPCDQGCGLRRHRDDGGRHRPRHLRLGGPSGRGEKQPVGHANRLRHHPRLLQRHRPVLPVQQLLRPADHDGGVRRSSQRRLGLQPRRGARFGRPADAEQRRHFRGQRHGRADRRRRPDGERPAVLERRGGPDPDDQRQRQRHAGRRRLRAAGFAHGRGRRYGDQQRRRRRARLPPDRRHLEPDRRHAAGLRRDRLPPDLGGHLPSRDGRRRFRGYPLPDRRRLRPPGHGVDQPRGEELPARRGDRRQRHHDLERRRRLQPDRHQRNALRRHARRSGIQHLESDDCPALRQRTGPVRCDRGERNGQQRPPVLCQCVGPEQCRRSGWRESRHHHRQLQRRNRYGCGDGCRQSRWRERREHRQFLRHRLHARHRHECGRAGRLPSGQRQHCERLCHGNGHGWSILQQSGWSGRVERRHGDDQQQLRHGQRHQRRHGCASGWIDRGTPRRRHVQQLLEHHDLGADGGCRNGKRHRRHRPRQRRHDDAFQLYRCGLGHRGQGRNLHRLAHL